MIDLKPLKNEALNYPDPLKTLILSSPDAMDEGEFITKFIEWRKIARISEIQIEVGQK